MITEDVQVIHTFTDAERGQFGLEQANLLDERKNIDNQAIQAKKLYAAQLAKADAEIGLLSLRIRTGTEPRMVRSLLIDHRPDPGYRLVVRTDNGHVFRRRKLEPNERQMNLIVGQQVPFAAIAMLPVEDKNWDTMFVEVMLWPDELDELKIVEPPLAMRPCLIALPFPDVELDKPIPTAERVIHVAEEVGPCEWCTAGHPFDSTLKNSHLVPQDGGGVKRRTCKDKNRKQD